MKNEKKWILLRIIATLLLLIAFFSFVVGIFLIPDSEYALIDGCGIIFACTFIGYFMIKFVHKNLASHWIQDRLNERIWIENNILYHFIQTAFAAGWNIRNADETARIYEYDIASIRNPKYDPKSGRIEFNVDGKLIYYKDYDRNIIGHTREIQGKPVVFYEYMKPSIYTHLAESGIRFELATLDFKVRDQHV